MINTDKNLARFEQLIPSYPERCQWDETVWTAAQAWRWSQNSEALRAQLVKARPDHPFGCSEKLTIALELQLPSPAGYAKTYLRKQTHIVPELERRKDSSNKSCSPTDNPHPAESMRRSHPLAPCSGCRVFVR